MGSPFKTCRCCGDKDVTVRWSAESGAPACVSCRMDGAKAMRRQARTLLGLDQHPMNLVKLSPASLRAMMEVA